MANPIYPRQGSLEAFTLLALHDNAAEGITHRTVDRMCHSYRLSSYTHNLAAKGWSFHTLGEQVSCFHGSRKSRIARYWLSAEHAKLLRTAEGAAFIKEARKALENAKAGGNRLEHTAITTQNNLSSNLGGAI